MQVSKKYFTKGERRFIRYCQENHIPFKSKIKINNREVDFIIGKYAVEIDGHPQDGSKNEMLVKEGYVPIHIDNSELKNNVFYKFSKRYNFFRSPDNRRR
jgi:very-short-patch-repair endonuclease